MRAVVVRQFSNDPRAHQIEEHEPRHPGPDDVRIAVRAASINFPDLLVMSGKYQVVPALPFTPGKDSAGIVEAVGANVRDVGPGDRVLAHLEHGCYASEIIARHDHVHRLPEQISFVEAAAMGLVYQTAYFALMDRGGFRAGETVLINGAGGGVGLAAVQLVKALGGKAFAGIGSPEKEASVRKAGADAVINLAATDLHNTLREQVFAANNDLGVDLVLDTIGGDVFDASLRAMAWCGRCVVIGFAAGRIPTVKANYLLVKNISVTGLQWSDYRDRAPWRVGEVHRELMRLHAAGLLRPLVMREYTLEQFADALECLASGKSIGKLVLTVD